MKLLTDAKVKKHKQAIDSAHILLATSIVGCDAQFKATFKHIPPPHTTTFVQQHMPF